MLSKTLRCFLILTCVVLLPLFAQTKKSAPPGTANETMGTNPATGTTTTATTTTTTTTKTVVHHKMHPVHTAARGKSKSRAYDDSTRLGSLLIDTQGNASLTPEAWKKVAGEAMSLANKEYGACAASGSSTARTAAKEARTHVRELHAAALKGDADGAKSHAGMALPYVVQIIDWSTPATK